MKILAIAPGPTQSVYVVWDGQKIYTKGKVPNFILQSLLSELNKTENINCLVIEKIEKIITRQIPQKYHDTIWWYGRFHGIWFSCARKPIEYISRSSVFSILVGKKAKGIKIDSIIRDKLIARFGAPINENKGINPITYGLSGDLWQAFAVAVAWLDRWEQEQLKK